MGLRRLAPVSDAVVIVDVLRFTTAVEVAVNRGAEVLPYRWHDGSEADFAAARDALLAVPSGREDAEHPWSLSPSSLRNLPSGSRIVVPSPNGSALAFAASEAGAGDVVAGCLRNAPAVGAALSTRNVVSVIAAGERWRGATGPMRVALEDQLGAGAVVSALGSVDASPEALAAGAAFQAAADDLEGVLRGSASGRELTGRGLAADVALASEHAVGDVVPWLVEDAFRAR